MSRYLRCTTGGGRARGPKPSKSADTSATGRATSRSGSRCLEARWLEHGASPDAAGTWGAIRAYPTVFNAKGKTISWRATTLFRGTDGRTRTVERRGRSAADAQNRSKAHLAEGARLSREGELNGLGRFSKAAELWRVGIEAQVQRDLRSPGTLETYERQLRFHVLPALGGVRLLEFSPPLIDRFLRGVSDRSGASTARTCRSVVSGVLGLAVRYGTLPTNPVRDADRLGGRPVKEPRASTLDERVRLFKALDQDEAALAADVPGLLRFMLATGLRIGECLGVLRFDVDRQGGRVDVSSTVIRWTGHGRVRKTTKSKAGERSLLIPSWMVTDLERRFSRGVRMDEPVFANSLGGVRDPKNTRRDIRRALDRAGFQ